VKMRPSVPLAFRMSPRTVMDVSEEYRRSWMGSMYLSESLKADATVDHRSTVTIP